MITLEPPPVRAETGRLPPAPEPGVWLETETLASRVAKLALSIDECRLVPVAGAGAGAALQPRSLLAVLIYSYASGIFSSEAIAEQMQEDTHFRALCGDDYPDWNQLRRFRRLNRPLIQQCLEALLAPVHGPACNHERPGAHRSPERLATAGGWEPDSQAAIAQEASDRLNRAARLDSMVLDE